MINPIRSLVASRKREDKLRQKLMKSYNHLWEKFIADDNIELALKNASKGKRKRNDVAALLENPNRIDIIRSYALNFRNAPHKPKQIYDGITRKVRTIIVPTFKEQVIHHMIVNILKPIFQKSMYYHSYGSLPNKGPHKGKKYLESYIRKHPKECKYCLKMDIRKYFESIPHSILIHKLENVIHDNKFMAILKEIISATQKGIPLGFYTSQWIANWYLTDLDHYIKEELGADCFVRYMDDMSIFGKTSEYLHTVVRKIQSYLRTKLGLTLKHNWQVFLFDFIIERCYKRIHRGRFLDFMGFKFYSNKTTLRKSIIVKLTRKAVKLIRKPAITLFDCRQYLSYKGWIKSSDTYNYYEHNLATILPFENCQSYISNIDRRINNELDKIGEHRIAA